MSDGPKKQISTISLNSKRLHKIKHTTVKKLIKHLKKFPPDAYVFVDGYEGGLDDPFSIVQDQVRLGTCRMSVDGPHFLASSNGGHNQTETVVTGIIIKRDTEG